MKRSKANLEVTVDIGACLSSRAIYHYKTIPLGATAMETLGFGGGSLVSVAGDTGDVALNPAVDSVG